MFQVAAGPVPPRRHCHAEIGPGIGENGGQQRGARARGGDDEKPPTLLGNDTRPRRTAGPHHRIPPAMNAPREF